MVHSSNEAIDKKIVQMRKDKFGLFRIHKWLVGWDNFSKLDEQVVLAHILNVLNQNKLKVTRNEVRYCFNKYYNKNSHGDKKGYLNWLCREFNVKNPDTIKKNEHTSILNRKEGFTKGFQSIKGISGVKYG